MIQRNSKTNLTDSGRPLIWNLIPISVLLVLVLAGVISVWNAAILSVIWLVLIQGNTEVFLVAFILAMIIRCFCVEVYKIPTGSMEPTLHGDYQDGDKIIANKFGILFNPIKRYDVFLFKFPLDKSTSFIKRVVGLPNEELLVKKGNLYARPKGTDKFLIAKKPLKIQESIWIPLIETRQAKQMPEERYNPNVPIKLWETAGADSNIINNETITLQAGESIAYKTIKDKYINNRNSGVNVVEDIKLSFKFRAENTGGEIYCTIKTQTGNFTLHLFPKPAQPNDSEPPNLTRHFRSPALSYTNNMEYFINGQLKEALQIDAAIKPNNEHLLEILNFDGTIYVKIDRNEVVKYDYIISLDDIQAIPDTYSAYQIELGTKKFPATISETKLWRDIYYDAAGVLKDSRPLAIPEGKYFAIGDNVPNSKDSRLWEMRTITLQNGKTIKCDANPSEGYRDDGNNITIARNKKNNRGGDIWGASHFINKNAIISNKEETAPFIDANEIFGRALFVYWPLKRVKLIR
jgi:signal peptidase I